MKNTWPEKLNASLSFLIGGMWERGDSKETHVVSNKFTGEKLADVQLASSKQVEQAIQASVSGFHLIRNWSKEERALLLEKVADELEFLADFFARLIVAEAGKPISLARAEVARGVSTLRIASRETLSFSGEEVPLDYGIGKGKAAVLRYYPIGTVSCITPFNYPLNLALHKIAPAIGSGNAFILKPPPQTPLTMMAFAVLLNEAGLPPGAGNILLCGNEAAAPLVSDERIKFFSFTGSDKVGWMLKGKAIKQKVALELGGNAAAFVDESADIESAVKQLVGSAFGYSGQVCISAQRIFIHKSIAEKFQSMFLALTGELKSGDPENEDVLNGPLIDQTAFDRISEWINEAQSQGAKILTGGKPLDVTGRIFAPTVFIGAGNGMKIWDEEVFGPVVCLDVVEDVDEAIRKINASRFGLQASIYSQNQDSFRKFADEVEAGGVMLNLPPSFRVDGMPYGGVKDSGMGREGIRYAMREMMEPKLIVS